MTNRHWNRPIARLGTGLFGVVLLAGLAWADNGPNHRTSNDNYGVSGGNVKDISKAFCCSGTLGSLVQAGSDKYILSNNHVLARAGAAAAGEDISQPGMIDFNCRVAAIVANFTVAPPLGSNVDAAIAKLRTNTMKTDGAIQDIGIISSVVKAPTIGLAVQKSGRTTGLTSGSISSINTSVNVQYQKGCGSGKKFVIGYTNQVVISSSTFSAGGDSGSLIVSKDSCPQPVALLYAGSSSTTIGNPIGEVLTKVGAALGSSVTVSFVGNPTCSSAGTAASTAATGPSDNLVSHATGVKDEHAAQWLRGPVIGAGVGAADDNPLEAVIVVYVDRTNGAAADHIPSQADGVRIRRVFTEPFEALPACGSCGGSGQKGQCK